MKIIDTPNGRATRKLVILEYEAIKKLPKGSFLDKK